MKHISSGDRVLYLGVGTGEDAIMAARQGAQVTCVEISQGMLDQVQRKFDAEGLTAELICGDAFEHDRIGHYDVCAINYFLNVFQRDDMRRMLHHSASLVRKGGKYLIADVALPQGNLLERGFNLFYLKMAMGSLWAMGLVLWHENYDYCQYFADANLSLEHVEFFRFARKGPVLFQSIVGQRL